MEACEEDIISRLSHVGKAVPPLQSVKSIRIAVSTVMDMLSKAFRGLDYDFVLKMV